MPALNKHISTLVTHLINRAVNTVKQTNFFSIYRNKILFIILLIFSRPTLGVEMMNCREIEDNSSRLMCYDGIPADTKEGKKRLLDEKSKEWFEKSDTPFKSRLRKEFSQTYDTFSITPHRPNYIMPVTYNNNVHSEVYEPFTVLDEDADDIDKTEVKFQLSFKIPITQRLLYDNASLWFGYTQVSFWQLYNSDISSPFRETNYEPEFMLAFQTDYDVLGMNNSLITLKLNHQSNGRSEPLSRSWNRIMASFVLEKDNFLIVFQPWYRIPEDNDDDDNPDIEDYMGYGNIFAIYKNGDQTYSLLFRNNLKSTNNRSTVELNWTFPVSERLKLVTQYFNGYGESLIDYNHRTQRVGLGIMLTNWL